MEYKDGDKVRSRDGKIYEVFDIIDERLIVVREVSRR